MWYLIDVNVVNVMLCIGFLERPSDFNNSLFIARLTDWPDNATYANGYVNVELYVSKQFF